MMAYVFCWFYIVFLTRTSAVYNNTANVSLTCDETDLTVYLNFEYPFQGRVFVSEQSYKPECSYAVAPGERTESFNMSINFSDCEVNLFRIENTSYISTTIEIKQHNMLSSIYDYMLNLTCQFNGTDIFPLIRPDTYLSNEFPEIESFLAVESGSQIYPEDVSDSLGISDELMITYHVKDGGYFNDMVVMNCIAYDDAILDEHTELYQLSHPLGCESDSDIISNFSLIRDSHTGSKMVAYASLKNVSLFSRGRLFISCGAQFCKNFCQPNQCSRDQHYRNFHFTDIATKNMVNRNPESKVPTSLLMLDGEERLRRSYGNDVLKYLINDTPMVIGEIAEFDHNPLNQTKELTSISRILDEMKNSSLTNPFKFAKRAVITSVIETPPSIPSVSTLVLGVGSAEFKKGKPFNQSKNLTSTFHKSDEVKSLVGDKMRLVKRAVNKPNEAASNNTQMLYRTRIILSRQPNQNIRNITFETEEFDRYDQLNQFKIYPSIYQKPDELRNLIGEKMGVVKTVNKLNETSNTQMSYGNKIVLSRQADHNITKLISDNTKLNDVVAKPLYDKQLNFNESTVTSRDVAPMNDSKNENTERAKRAVKKSNIETPPHSLHWILSRTDVFKIYSSNGVPVTLSTNDELVKFYRSRINALNYTQSLQSRALQSRALQSRALQSRALQSRALQSHALQSKVLNVNRKEIKNGTLLHSNFFSTSALNYTQSLTKPKSAFIHFVQITIAGLFLCGVSYVCYFLFSVRYRPAFNVAHHLNLATLI